MLFSLFLSALISSSAIFLSILTIITPYLLVWLPFTSSNHWAFSNTLLPAISDPRYVFCWGLLEFFGAPLLFFLTFQAIMNLIVRCCLRLFLIVPQAMRFFVYIFSQSSPFLHRIGIWFGAFSLRTFPIAFSIETGARLDGLFSWVEYVTHSYTLAQSASSLIFRFHQLNYLAILTDHSLALLFLCLAFISNRLSLFFLFADFQGHLRLS